MDRRTALKQSALWMGYGMAASVFSGALTGCVVDTGDSWKPEFFSQEEGDFIAEIAEHILPATDTPGAKALLVHRFLDKVIANTFSEEAQKEFREGLTSLGQACKNLTGKSFTEGGQKERDDFLTSQEEKELKPDKYLWGNKIASGGEPDFYRQLKGLCLFGFFSSEAIGKNVLNYVPVPGKFIGCVPLEEIGNAWTF